MTPVPYPLRSTAVVSASSARLSIRCPFLAGLTILPFAQVLVGRIDHITYQRTPHQVLETGIFAGEVCT